MHKYYEAFPHTVPDTSYLRFYAELPSRFSAEYRTYNGDYQ